MAQILFSIRSAAFGARLGSSSVSKIEQKLSKDQILSATSTWSRRGLTVCADAAWVYFKTSLQTYSAGNGDYCWLAPAPNLYSPVNVKAAQQRRNLVLQRMREWGD